VEQWTDRFHIHVMIADSARKFHELSRVPGLHFVAPASTKIFAVSIHAGQPFDWTGVCRMSELGVANVFLMLDTIAYDCLYLNTPSLTDLWNFVMGHANGVVYISEFVRSQFNRRFSRGPNLKEIVAYPSLDARDYGSDIRVEGPGQYLLVVGNKFAHKGLAPTITALAAAFPREKIVVIGMTQEFGENVICHESGLIEERAMDSLYANAKLVIYPSFYEGFGIPVIKALTFRKPVMARRMPVMQELAELGPSKKNLHLYRTTNDLIDRLKNGIPGWTNDGPAAESPSYGWREAAVDIRALIDETLASDTLRDALVGRLLSLRAWSSGPAHGAAGPGGELSRIQAQIEEIHASWSWRLTAPLRTVAGWFLRASGRLPQD
jgi:glycosyltransferase involved in cell wall biosynthesis